MLNLAALRLIKPVGSEDNYESRPLVSDSNKQKGDRFILEVTALLNGGRSMSVNEILVATGHSQGGTHTMMVRMWHENLVIREPRKTKGSKKYTYFYSLVSQC